ncbi:MAG: hypothetical protein GF383_09710, partial [Candidatus Lokiarchaeota archaeon]|nr:hypothetical protein [Candidatus Lokiarchaeota archaeon]MBD3340800.1 hypothetical protein [Candidatus Lokiarchaeota archaeon]
MNVYNLENIPSHLDKVPAFFKDYFKNFLADLKQELGKEIISLILYGSIARGTLNKESDIDLLLIVSNDQSNLVKDKKISGILIDFYRFSSRKPCPLGHG